MKKAKLLPFLFQAAQDYREVLLGRQFLFIGQKAKDGPYPVLECLFRKENFMHLTGCQIAEGLSAKNFFDLCIRKRLGFEMFTYQPDAFLKKDVFSSVFALPYTARMILVGEGIVCSRRKLRGMYVVVWGLHMILSYIPMPPIRF